MIQSDDNDSVELPEVPDEELPDVPDEQPVLQVLAGQVALITHSNFAVLNPELGAIYLKVAEIKN